MWYEIQDRTSNATTTQQVQLPMDEVAAIAATLFPESKIPVKPSRLAQVTTQDTELCAKTKDNLRKNIWTKWVNEDYPEYYRYRPPFRDCWSFMTFPKFQAGRIHQMRAQQELFKCTHGLVEPRPGSHLQ